MSECDEDSKWLHMLGTKLKAGRHTLTALQGIYKQDNIESTAPRMLARKGLNCNLQVIQFVIFLELPLAGALNSCSCARMPSAYASP